MVSWFIAGVILGFFSCAGSIIAAAYLAVRIADKKREPTKEEWRLH